MTPPLFFDSWIGLLRVVLVGTCAYVALLLLLKISGKRALAKLSAFDLVVTVAIGSTLATVLLSSDVALAEGVVAMALLLGLQWTVATLATRSRRLERLIKSEPTLLYRGGFLHGPMTASRLTEDELRQAARSEGYADLSKVQAMVLENDGTISVLGEAPGSLDLPSTGLGSGDLPYQ